MRTTRQKYNELRAGMKEEPRLHNTAQQAFNYKLFKLLYPQFIYEVDMLGHSAALDIDCLRKEIRRREIFGIEAKKMLIKNIGSGIRIIIKENLEIIDLLDEAQSFKEAIKNCHKEKLKIDLRHFGSNPLANTRFSLLMRNGHEMSDLLLEMLMIYSVEPT